MNSRQSLVPFGVLAVTALLFCPSNAGAQVRWYRYWLNTKADTQEVFVNELPRGARLAGSYYEVHTDSVGRVTRISSYEDGEKTFERVYQFVGKQRWYGGYDSFAATGEKTGSEKLSRNERGVPTRYESFSVNGELTGYSTGSLNGDQTEWITYAATGKQTARYVYFYSSRGHLIRSQWYPEAGTVYDQQVDEVTGLAQSRKKFINDSLRSSNKYTYDSDGSLTRADIYDQNDKWYGEREYAHGLHTRTFYQFSDSSTKEIRFAFDDKRRIKQSTLSINGRVVCTFTYDRLSDGTVKRSLAVGPDGELLAEYPDLFVYDVNQHGDPLDSPPGTGIRHKTANWW